MSIFSDNPKIKFNQINIPGTHDSGTYVVDVNELSIINSF
jgi:hypothetical protein